MFTRLLPASTVQAIHTAPLNYTLPANLGPTRQQIQLVKCYKLGKARVAELVLQLLGIYGTMSRDDAWPNSSIYHQRRLVGCHTGGRGDIPPLAPISPPFNYD